jgi:hypothetical protein
MRPPSNLTMQSSSFTHAMIDRPRKQSLDNADDFAGRPEIRRRDTSVDMPRPSPEDFAAASKPGSFFVLFLVLSC